MTITEKLIILNKAAQQLREAMSSLVTLFKDNSTISHYIWKINKLISDMHKEISNNIQKDVTQEQYDDIVKNIKETGNDG